MIESILNLVIILFASSVLAVQIAYESELAFSIKKIFGLAEPNSKLIRLSQFSTYKKVFNDWVYLGLPIVLPIIIITNGYKFLNKLFNCPYCLSFHISWVFLLLLNPINNFTIVQVFIYALLGILTTHIYESVASID